MSNIEVEQFEGTEITDDLLASAVKLFSENYGVWGSLAESKMGSFAKKGARVKMTAQFLKKKCMASNGSIYIRALLECDLVGNVFATRWEHEGRPTCWVTQLCISSAHRNRGIAKLLLSKLQEPGCSYGILSSHPFAICAFLRVFGHGIEDFDLTEKRDCAVMQTCPVEYVAKAKLCEEHRRVCCTDTEFWVDHEEPKAALATLREKGAEWQLGELPEGHEYLALVTTTTCT